MRRWTGVLFFLMLTGAATADDPDPVGEILGASCTSCHGGEASALPRLSDLAPAQIRSALLAYRSGERQGTAMNRIARGYTDAEINALAQAFTSP